MGGVLFQIDTDQAKRRFEALGVDSERYLDAYEQRGIFLDLESGAIGDEEFVSRLSDIVIWYVKTRNWYKKEELPLSPNGASFCGLYQSRKQTVVPPCGR